MNERHHAPKSSVLDTIYRGGKARVSTAIAGQQGSSGLFRHHASTNSADSDGMKGLKRGRPDTNVGYNASAQQDKQRIAVGRAKYGEPETCR